MPDRRPDLAAFLRSRRERITPEMVGMPPGRRRRTPGLRREEVAQLAGVGVTWYTWLEQGRPINASVQVLDAVARTLQLDHAERQHLYRLAGLPAAAPDPVGAGVTPETQEVLDALAPLAAVISTSRGDLLAWNPPYAAMFPLLVRAPEGERNSMWHTFVSSAWTTTLINRESELQGAVAVFRGSYSRHAEDPCWRDFVRDLRAASPEFARMWATQDVAEPGPREKIFHNDAVGEMRFRTTSFNLSASPETRMIVYAPVDEAARSALIWLTASDHTSIQSAPHGMLNL